MRVEVETSVLNCGLILFDLGFGYVNGVLFCVVVLPRNGSLIRDARHAIKIDLGQIKRRLRLAEIGLCHTELRRTGRGSMVKSTCPTFTSAPSAK